MSRYHTPEQKAAHAAYERMRRAKNGPGRRKAIPWQERLIPEPNSGCWLWEGAIDGSGYGIIGRKGTTLKVHRLAWEAANGQIIPEGMRICHRCDVPACCNPNHLFLGTQQDNVTDMINKGRFKGGSSLNALKTHCPYGHAYTPENTMTYNGMRSCRQCNRERATPSLYPNRRKLSPSEKAWSLRSLIGSNLE